MFVFKAAVVGAGAMGAEIAYAIASAGIPVVLTDVDRQAVEAGLARAEALWQAQVDAGKLDAGELQRGLTLIEAATDLTALADVDFVVEAVPDDLEVKQAVLAELDAATPGHAILASTTSTLSISELADATIRPDRVVGFHFPRPAAGARAVEVVEGDGTAPETMATALNFAQTIRKTPVRSHDAPGFVINRILGATSGGSGAPAARENGGAGHPAGDDERAALGAFVEACLVLEEGIATAKDIDVGMAAGAGMTPPPLQRADAEGLDAVLERLTRAEGEWGEAFAPPLILRRLVAQGRLGRKAGQGFFPYPRPDGGWEESPVKLETRGDIAIAWLDRPPANSISPDVVEALTRVWRAVEADSNIRALVIASANPQLFCAGADIKAFTRMDEAAARVLAGEMHDLLRSFERSRIVTIAAVNALAFGGGCELAMACDIRLGAESALFGQPEINLGIIPGFGGTQRLPRLVGTSKALEMNLTAEPVGGEEAWELGLVNRLVPDHELIDTALAWGRKLAGQAPLAVEQIKRVSGRSDLDEGIAAERDAFAAVFGSEDAREGFSAFVQKRPARFRGR